MTTETDTLRDEGRRLFADGSLSEAMEHFQLALNGYTKAGSTLDAAEMMNDIGVIHRREGRLDEAAEMLEKARAVFAEASDGSREAQTLGNLAELYRKQKDANRAIATFKQAAAMFAELNDHDREGEILMSQGLLEFEIGKRLDGLTTYETGLKMISRPTSSQKRVLTLLRLRKAILGR